MDVYRARTAARWIGLLMLVAAALVLGLMQRSLVAMKRSRGETATSPSHAAAVVAARQALGPAARIAAALDLDGDGRAEYLAELADPSTPPGVLRLRRVAVLTPGAGSGFAILFDSNRLDTTGAPPPGTAWRLRRASLRRFQLESVAAGGSVVDVEWVAAEGRYRTRVVTGATTAGGVGEERARENGRAARTAEAP